MKIQQTEGNFNSQDGLRLFEQSWFPLTEPKAVILIVHGYAEHSSRYAHVGEFFAKHNYAVRTFDMRGHGQSEGHRAYVSSFDDYLDDLEAFMHRSHASYPETPLFLLGHSMGGAVVTLFLIKRQINFSGAIVTGAALKIGNDISPMLIKISTVLSRIAPKLATISLDSSTISRDPEVVARYDNDPYVYRKGTLARTGAEMVRATRLIQKNMEAVSSPILIMHGGEDNLTDPQGSKDLHRRAASQDKTLKIYPQLYHEILNEPEKEVVLQDILNWIESRIK